MATGHGVEDDPSGVCRTSPVGFFLLAQRIERKARIARDAAIGDAIVRAFAAATRGMRLLASTFRDAFALRDMLMPARQRSRMQHPNHYQ